MNFSDVQKRIISAHDRLHSWRKVGLEFGISKGTADRIGDGIEPRDIHIRSALGLDVLIPAPACRICGDVHVSKRCTRPRQLAEPWESAIMWLREMETKARTK